MSLYVEPAIDSELKAAILDACNGIAKQLPAGVRLELRVAEPGPLGGYREAVLTIEDTDIDHLQVSETTGRADCHIIDSDGDGQYDQIRIASYSKDVTYHTWRYLP